MQYRLRQGTETILLSGDSPILGVDYRPKVAITETEPAQETLGIAMGGTAAAKMAMKDKIEAWLYQAAQYQERKIGERVYVEGQIVDGGEWSQSELLGGEVVWVQPSLVASDDVSLAVSWRRRNEWLAPMRQAPTTNRNGTRNTMGLTVWNHTDSGEGHDNFVQIDGADILGSMPAPTRIEMLNNFDDSNRLYNVWIAHNVHSDPAYFQHVIEAENATYARGGAISNNALYSNGAARSFVWTGDEQTLIASWTLPTAFLNRARGNWFKVLARFIYLASTGLRLQFKVTFPAGYALSVVSTSQEVAPTSSFLQDVATLQLPPWLIGENDFHPIDLNLYARCPGGGTITIDDLQLLPLDGYRILTPRGYGLVYGARLVDDGINQTIWTDGWSPAGKTGHYTGQFDAIRLMPGATQRLYFLQSMNTGGVGPGRTMQVKVFYQPRRLSL